MAGEDAFKVEGRVVAAASNGTYRVELANGHRLLGFVPGRARQTSPGFAPGDRVRLRLTPCDLSVGMIVVGNVNRNENAP
jgi:translation initiation factor IF-1